MMYLWWEYDTIRLIIAVGDINNGIITSYKV